MVTFDKNKLSEQIKELSKLPQLKEVKALRKRLEIELKKLSEKEKPVLVSKVTDKVSSNQKRSSKLEKYWRYIKLVRDHFPNLTTKEIRSQLKQRRQGIKTKIPDAIWQNPSP